MNDFLHSKFEIVVCLMESVRRVLKTAESVVTQQKHVQISEEHLSNLVNDLESKEFAYGSWAEYHFDPTSVPKEWVVAFVCIIDSINFCFWPLDGFEYEHLIYPFKSEINNETSKIFSPEFLSTITSDEL